jgi:hypothetical protein
MMAWLEPKPGSKPKPCGQVSGVTPLVVSLVVAGSAGAVGSVNNSGPGGPGGGSGVNWDYPELDLEDLDLDPTAYEQGQSGHTLGRTIMMMMTWPSGFNHPTPRPTSRVSQSVRGAKATGNGWIDTEPSGGATREQAGGQAS